MMTLKTLLQSVRRCTSGRSHCFMLSPYRRGLTRMHWVDKSAWWPRPGARRSLQSSEGRLTSMAALRSGNKVMVSAIILQKTAGRKSSPGHEPFLIHSHEASTSQTHRISINVGIRADEKGTSPHSSLHCCSLSGGWGCLSIRTHSHCFYFHSSYRTPLWASISSSAKIN